MSQREPFNWPKPLTRSQIEKLQPHDELYSMKHLSDAAGEAQRHERLRVAKIFEEMAARYLKRIKGNQP